MGQDDPQGLFGESGGERLLIDFLLGLVPTIDVGLAAGAAGLGVALAGGQIAGRLRRRGTRVAYTRKIFHFVVFTAAAFVHVFWDLPGAMAFGTVMAIAVLVSVARGEGDLLYDAMAREKDAPHEGRFIVVPLVTTAVGGLASALVAGPLATVGYMAAGWGDAVGEPVGATWGRHPYKVPSLFGVPAERTWEGSSAVFVAATAACLVAFWAEGYPMLVGPAIACGAVAAVVEGISHHGVDNLTVPLAVSLAALWLVG